MKYFLVLLLFANIAYAGDEEPYKLAPQLITPKLIATQQPDDHTGGNLPEPTPPPQQIIIIPSR